MTGSGSITCVGIGMTLGAHMTPQARHCIKESDVVFVAASSGVVEKWVEEMHHDVRSLQAYYANGKPRTQTYREMVDAMMTEVRAGKHVCGAFYGHPGVFAQAPPLRRCAGKRRRVSGMHAARNLRGRLSVGRSWT